MRESESEREREREREKEREREGKEQITGIVKINTITTITSL